MIVTISCVKRAEIYIVEANTRDTSRQKYKCVNMFISKHYYEYRYRC